MSRGDYFDEWMQFDFTPVPDTAVMTGICSDGREVDVPFEYEQVYGMCWKCGEEMKLCARGECSACDENRRRKLCWGCISAADADDSWWWRQNVKPPQRIHALVRIAS